MNFTLNFPFDYQKQYGVFCVLDCTSAKQIEYTIEMLNAHRLYYYRYTGWSIVQQEHS